MAARARARSRECTDGGAPARGAHPRGDVGVSVLRDRAAEDAVRAGMADRRSGDAAWIVPRARRRTTRSRCTRSDACTRRSPNASNACLTSCSAVLISIAVSGRGCRADVLSHLHGISRLRAAMIGDALVERHLAVEEDGVYRCAHPLIARVVSDALGDDSPPRGASRASRSHWSSLPRTARWSADPGRDRASRRAGRRARARVPVRDAGGRGVRRRAGPTRKR